MWKKVFNVYEDICKNQYLPELIIKNTFGFTPTKIGKWWDRKDREIDIVATDNSYNIIFGEWKYTKKPLDVNVYYDLLEKAKKVNWNMQNRNEYFVFFLHQRLHGKKCKTLQKKIWISFCIEINTSLVKRHWCLIEHWCCFSFHRERKKPLPFGKDFVCMRVNIFWRYLLFFFALITPFIVSMPWMVPTSGW